MNIAITLNTGFDEIFAVSRNDTGQVGQVLSHRSLPSGKGINAARAIRDLGGEVKIIAFVGQVELQSFQARLDQEGLAASLIAVPSATRRNLTFIQNNTQPASHFRAEGFQFDDAKPLEQLLGALRSQVREGDLVSLHGSTPKGLPTSTWAEIATAATKMGAEVLVDIYDEPLPLVLRSTSVLACKCNQEEISVFSDVQESPKEVTPSRALFVMHKLGARFAFVTLGRAGIVFLEDGAIWHASCAAKQEAIFVGAGDACMAALILSLARKRRSIKDAASFMAAVGAAYVGGAHSSELHDIAHQLLDSVRLARL